ncbi:MAG: ABC transporter permease [Gammaproteobacteria bacterium]|nr:ABC transporter permease [Gammaproteobacteria bacterium]MCW8841670.1 ABC transporter permease [Gammaproteobacteria bacterium]MCW8958118.1 ABC transporter permease [Gammaproteobacteria bacterium]MCW8973701.1 ABC transporter permease [Gammaproteobacteria bacterium]MCW8993565.1 ABC transporter permease [Gammaproteobacteria bacterium]
MTALLKAILAMRWVAVWQRNARVWRRLAGPALLGNIGEPLLYLVALGFGLGAFVGEVEGMDYITFLASGFVCASMMNTASFEGIYSAYTRMAVQETWTAMLYTPLAVRDILLGEALWAASKSVLSAIFILIVAGFLGAVHGWQVIGVLPVALLTGLTFAAMALVVTAVSRSYDFFLYYFTLLLTPMLLFSGVFFPIEGMPPLVQQAAALLPLTHAIELVRPMMTGQPLSNVPLHLAVLLAYAVAALLLAGRLIERRLFK